MCVRVNACVCIEVHTLVLSGWRRRGEDILSWSVYPDPEMCLDQLSPLAQDSWPRGRAGEQEGTWVWGWQPGPSCLRNAVRGKRWPRLSLLPTSQLLGPAPPPTQPGPCLEGPSAPGLWASMSLPGHLLAHSLAAALGQPAVYCGRAPRWAPLLWSWILCFVSR